MSWLTGYVQSPEDTRIIISPGMNSASHWSGASILASDWPTEAPRGSSTVRNCHRKKGGRGNCRCWLHQSRSCKFKTSFVKMNSKDTSFHLSRLLRYKSSLFLCALCICINIKSLSDDLFLQLFTEQSNKWLFILFIKVFLKNNGS